MAVRNEHLIVVMLEQLEKGKEFEVWPPHITIVPWFPCFDFKKLDNLLSGIASKTQAFIVSAGKRETWGIKDKYDVALIDDPGEFHQLHWAVFHGLEKNGFPVHQKDYLGAKYTPHVALRNHLQKDWDYKERQELIIDSFALISQVRLKKSGRMIKSVKKEYYLK